MTCLARLPAVCHCNCVCLTSHYCNIELLRTHVLQNGVGLVLSMALPRMMSKGLLLQDRADGVDSVVVVLRVIVLWSSLV